MVPKFLQGIRIADLTWAGAGPYATKVFSDLGAEVLKIESAVRPDPVRKGMPYKEGLKGLNRSGYFASRNNGKRSVSVNLRRAEGRDLVKKIAARSDIISNNFTPEVMDRLGLGYDAIREVKPDIIYLGMPMYGESGPRAKMLGVGMTIAAVSGLTAATGYHLGPPIGPGTHFPDHAVNPYHGAFALMSALRYRRLTGRGMKIDLSQAESTINSVGALFLQCSLQGTEPQRTGNRSRCHAPHNMFRCKGDDAWCAIAVLDDEQWQSLCRVMVRPDLAGNSGLAAADGRLARIDEVEAAVSAWTELRDPFEVMTTLQAAGVAAGVVESSRDLLDTDIQLEARGYWQVIDHPEMGETRFTSPPYLVDGERVTLRRPPLLGEHTDEALTRILGMTPAEVAQMRAQEILK